MTWIVPQHSRNRVKRAGSSVLRADTHSDEFNQAVSVFLNWRAAHAYPMQIMLLLLRRHASRVDSRTIVVQRLKRTGSIFMKLHRERNMSLNRMHDIAGCRAVVRNIAGARRVYDSLRTSRTRNILFREYDYITTPRDSGYRGLHLIYKYNGGRTAFQDMLVELQIRSRIQHSWATAVEIVGTFTKQALKASHGDSRWLDFFKYTSAEFARLEGCEVADQRQARDGRQRLCELFAELDVARRMPAFSVAARAISKTRVRGAGYFVLMLDVGDGIVRWNWYSKTRAAEATAFYDSMEERHRSDDDKDIVLVSADSVRELKRAYPNYFADSHEFAGNLKRALESVGGCA
ncbi:MAG: RelA/SpoT domain-containing protein [Candidatus Eisenbacteria sp.]|nr:RelA/SpoT domain-containing protein [Candidatus Eisenbacteria bacterium]